MIPMPSVFSQELFVLTEFQSDSVCSDAVRRFSEYALKGTLRTSKSSQPTSYSSRFLIYKPRLATSSQIYRISPKVFNPNRK